MPESSYLTVAQVAAWLGLSEAAVRHRVQRKSMPFRRVGSSLRFDPVEIEAWTREEAAASAPVVLIPKTRRRTPRATGSGSAVAQLKALGY